MLTDITLDEVDGKVDLIDVINREMQVHLGEKTYIYTSEKLLAALIDAMTVIDPVSNIQNILRKVRGFQKVEIERV